MKWCKLPSIHSRCMVQGGIGSDPYTFKCDLWMLAAVAFLNLQYAQREMLVHLLGVET